MTTDETKVADTEKIPTDITEEGGIAEDATQDEEPKI